MSREEGGPDTYLSNSASTVPPGEEVLVLVPYSSSNLLSKPRWVDKLGKADDCLVLDDLRGEAGVAPRKAAKATGGTLCKVWLLRYSDIFGNDSGLEFAVCSKYSHASESSFENS